VDTGSAAETARPTSIAPVGSWRRQPGLTVSSESPQLVAVLDTNALANACCHEAGTGFSSLVTRLVNTGRIPCFIADHVPDEMDEHLERICRSRKVDPAEAFRVWHSNVAPLLRIVELPIGEYLRPEIAAIRRPAPDGDPDDWPTLALAAFLGPAAVVTSDSVFSRLGYSNVVDDWTLSATALRQVADLEGRHIDRILMALTSARLLSAGARGVLQMTRRFPWVLPALALGAGWLAATAWTRRDGIRHGLAAVRDAVAAPLQRMLEELSEYAELRTSLVTVQDPPWRQETLTERCARYLARSGEPMTPTQLRDALSVVAGPAQRITAAGIRRCISAHPSFHRLPGDRYQVGSAIDVRPR
jgi:predicted nucleic acid-binding protein